VIGAAQSIHEHLARLVVYPKETFHEDVAGCRAALQSDYPEAGTAVLCFEEAIRDDTVEEVDELFTRTFDINPVCSLEVGWQLFGENYGRGEFLVTMRQVMRDAGLPESSELPDHLMHVLLILGRAPREWADEFAAMCVIPAIDKMLKGLQGKSNPYANVLQAIRDVIAVRHATAASESNLLEGEPWTPQLHS